MSDYFKSFDQIVIFAISRYNEWDWRLLCGLLEELQDEENQ